MQASFTTYLGERPHTCGIVVDCRDTVGDVPLSNFTTLASAAHRPDALAFGKIALLRQGGIAVYQADASGRIAPAFCGNATAAAMRHLHGDGACEFKIFGASADHTVQARIKGRTVSQVWLVPEANVEERVWRRRRVLILDSLNPYALVIGSLPRGVDPEAARRELLGDGLATKLAVITKHRVEFYNTNGRHGAAPQTGVASMALAARRVPWFAELLLGMPSLPAISQAKDGRLAIAMPMVTVELRELSLPRAA